MLRARRSQAVRVTLASLTLTTIALVSSWGPAAARAAATAVPARASTGTPLRFTVSSPSQTILPQAGTLPQAGILPPKNPPKNLPPIPNFYGYCAGGVLDRTTGCNSKALAAVDQARGTEPVGALKFNLAKLLKLSVVDQLFAIADMERVSRGEPPMVALTSQLDKVAQAGANASEDPNFTGSTLTGGAAVEAWGSNWAGGTESALGSDEGWMYDDGYGGENGDCTSPTASGCWGHRDNILGLWPQDLATRGCPAGRSQLFMGAGYALTKSAYATSFTQLFVAACGARPTDEVYTWDQAEAAIGFGTKITDTGIASSPDGKGYFVVNSAGKLSVAGDAHNAGDLSASNLAAPIAGMAVDDANGGYWLVGSNGEVYPFGHAPSHGDLRHDRLAFPVIGIAADKATGGYWLATSNGAVFSFDAPYHGGASTKKLPKPIVAIVADPVAAGYWLVGANGSVYPFGAAKSWGSEAGKHLPAPIVAAAVTKDGRGYWLAASNGSVFKFGDAVFKGSEAGKHLSAHVTAMAATPASTGYWLLGATGVVYRFNAP